MKIIHEYTPKLNIPQGVTLSCLFHKACVFYGACGKKKRLFLFKSGEPAVLSTKHAFHKMTYIPQNQAYIMSAYDGRSTSALLHVLDDCFNEIDCIRTQSRKIEDIYFDESLQLIFVVTPPRIQKYNCNGDYLGTFMNTHKKRRYKALCTFGEFIFLAYQKDNCMYIASYNLAGAYLEQINLGSAYTVQNMQVIKKNGCPILNVYTLKNSCYPFFIEIGLNGRQDLLPACLTHENIQIECVNEDDTIQTTAYIKNR